LRRPGFGYTLFWSPRLFHSATGRTKSTTELALSKRHGITLLFKLWDAYGNIIWQIPASNLICGSNGFSSSIMTVTWPTDPTGATNPPSITSLKSGASYTWAISTIDSNGNIAQMQATFSAP